MKTQTAPCLDEKPLILASRSPRRIALLRQMGLPFEVRPSEVNEETAGGKHPFERAVNAARLKADDLARQLPERLVLGADTMVCLDDRILGKPCDEDEARAMLQGLRNRWHTVVTGLCILASPGRSPWTALESTRVRMADFSDAELQAYIATGEPFDKAGGYAIQGEAGRFVAEIAGDYFNVVGLPLELMLNGLSQFVDVTRFAVPPPPRRFAPSP